MLLYDWGKIYEASGGSSKECYRIFKMLTKAEVPYNKYDKLYKYRNYDFSGLSFLIHPERLVYEFYRYTHKDICIYVALASLRSLAEYKISGTKTLELSLSKANPKDYLNKPSLLYVQNGLIHFVYEED